MKIFKAIKKMISKAFSAKGLMFLVAVYSSVFVIEVVRKNTSLSKHEENLRERMKLDGGFFQNLF